MADEPKWTKGPLTVRKAAAFSDCGIISEGKYVAGEAFADIRRNGEDSRAEALANATLWAAAPDMYAALATIALWREAGWARAGFIDAAQMREHEDETIRVAIAKARGAA